MGLYLRNKDTLEVAGPLDDDSQEYIELKRKRSAVDGRPLWEGVNSCHAGHDHSPQDAELKESDAEKVKDESKDQVLAQQPHMQ